MSRGYEGRSLALEDRFIALDFSVMKADNTVRIRRDIGFVGDKNDGIAFRVQALEKRQIHHTFAPSEEGHVWRNWRNYLADFVPQLFR